MVIPISEVSLDYAQHVRTVLRKAKIHVDVDSSDRKMQKKIREAQLAQYNYFLVHPSCHAGSRHKSCIVFCLHVQSVMSLHVGMHAWVVLHKLSATCSHIVKVITMSALLLATCKFRVHAGSFVLVCTCISPHWDYSSSVWTLLHASPFDGTWWYAGCWRAGTERANSECTH